VTTQPPSFGRSAGPVLQPVAVDMPTQLPAATLPVIIAVDPESMARFSQELTAVISAAVRAGYATAVEDIEFEAEEADNYENPSAEFRNTLAEFVRDNQELLERLGKASSGPVGTDPLPDSHPS
jgi:hypothetical protein